MPYAQAVILEIQRHGSVISPGERVGVEGNAIDGIFYRKVSKRLKQINSIVSYNLHCMLQGTRVAVRLHDIHQSKELWEDPESFRPERFLNEDGTRVKNKGQIMPFGYGKWP